MDGLNLVKQVPAEEINSIKKFVNAVTSLDRRFNEIAKAILVL